MSAYSTPLHSDNSPPVPSPPLPSPPLPLPVPDPPQNLVVAPLSTQYLLATWDEVTDTDVLRGPLGELMYFISVVGRRVAEINASETSRLLGPNDLGQLGRAYTVEVCVSIYTCCTCKYALTCVCVCVYACVCVCAYSSVQYYSVYLWSHSCSPRSHSRGCPGAARVDGQPRREAQQ